MAERDGEGVATVQPKARVQKGGLFASQMVESGRARADTAAFLAP